MNEKRYTVVLGLSLLALAACNGGLPLGTKHSSADHSAPGGPTSCPLTTPAQWSLFLQTAAANDHLVDTCEDSPCDPAAYAAVQNDVQAVLDQCAGVIAATPQVAACTKNLRTFIPTWLQQHSVTGYGFRVDTKAYLAAEEGPDRPAGMMTVPDQILAALPDPVKVEEAARTNGWRYITHDSALSPIDSPAPRTFIYKPDPAGRFDQWMLLNLGQGDATSVNTVMPLSFIGVQKTDAAGHPLDKVRLNFRDFDINKTADGSFSVSPREDGNGKCYSCHPSGMRRLITYHTPVLEAKPVKGEPDYDPTGAKVPPDFAFKRLNELNSIIASYGMPDWDGNIVPTDHGPALGQEQGCTGCHDGKTRGILTVSTSTDQLIKKVYYQLSMPAEPDAARLLEGDALKSPPLTAVEDAKLTKLQDDHGAITDAVLGSRFPMLQSWLTETACE